MACSHFRPLCCPSRRQWWLFSKLTPPTKACDHLSCQLASAETTNQTTVRVALKISPQKMCHLHMLFRTQWHIFHFYFCSFACGKLYLQSLGKCQTALYVWHLDVMCGSLLEVHVKSFWLKINYTSYTLYINVNFFQYKMMVMLLNATIAMWTIDWVHC